MDTIHKTVGMTVADMTAVLRFIAQKATPDDHWYLDQLQDSLDEGMQRDPTFYNVGFTKEEFAALASIIWVRETKGDYLGLAAKLRHKRKVLRRRVMDMLRDSKII